MSDIIEPVTGTASGAVGTGGGWGGGKLAGFVISETAGAAATVNVRDGGASGTIIFRINLAANQTVPVITNGRMNFSTGDVYFEVLSGAVRWTALKV